MASAEPSIGAAAPAVSLRSELTYLSALFVWFAGAALLGAGHEVPVIDDWTYAYSVERLLSTGRFDVLDFSAVFPLSSTLWGSLWASVLGFSFVTLRLSTLALALIATTALYLTLRELHASKPIALLGAFVVAANPTFYLLSSSFMTDVPFVTSTMLALFCYVRAASRGRASLLWWAGFWSMTALFNRQVGVITPVAGLPLLLYARRDAVSIPRRQVAIALVATWAAMGASWVMLMRFVPPTSIMTELGDRLQYIFVIPLSGYLAATVTIVTILAFHTLPALLALATTQSRWRLTGPALALASAGAIVFSIYGNPPEPLKPGSIWSLHEIGMTRALVGGQWSPDDHAWVDTAVRGGGTLASALGVVLIALGLWRQRRSGLFTGDRTTGADPGWIERVRGAIARTHLTPVIAYLATYLLLTHALWFYHDRYWLPMLFAVVIVMLGRRTMASRVPVFAWAVLVIFAATAILGTRDTLRFNEAVRASWQSLVDRGVKPSDIDAGYTWNGWVLYAHPENLAHGAKATTDVPMISTHRAKPYMLAMSPSDDYVVEREVAWDDRVWPNPDRLFVLKRSPGSKPAAPAAQRTTP